MSYPASIRRRAERIMVTLVMSTFVGYVTIFAISATRFMA